MKHSEIFFYAVDVEAAVSDILLMHLPGDGNPAEEEDGAGEGAVHRLHRRL